ncbi:hypothetical protein SCUCBS95973_007631 [Sporothrix curviconia]|uniref:Uncharacterized protein n=1 Tax=Sporothrix curviconia TaxID=1260050 RepID=A0ABP0CF77_9PEZI
MRPNERPYEFPTLVIDLDSEGNPDVRPYDEAVDGEAETAKWADAHASIDALAERLGDFEVEVEEAKARMLATAAQPTAWRVLDRDIWSAVLRGPQEYEEPVVPQDPGNEASVMANVLHRNGISPRQTFQQIPLLLHREEAARAKTPVLSGEQLAAAIKGCQNQSLIEVRRVLALAVQTSGGRAAIRENSDAIANLLGSHLQWGLTAPPTSTESIGVETAREVSEMLLNLSFTQTLKTGEITDRFRPQTASLWAAGLWAAALAGETAAMRRFLQLALGNGSPADVREFLGAWTPQPTPAQGEQGPRKSAAELALEALLVRLRSSPVSFAGQRAELLTLLTGTTRDMGPMHRKLSFLTVLAHQPPADEWSVSSSGKPVLSQEASLGILSPETVAFGKLFTAVLAELGAVMGMWEQLRHQELVKNERGAISDYISTDTLVTAVVRHAAMSPLITKQTEAGKAMTPSSARGCLYDMRNIILFEQSLRPTRSWSVFTSLRPTVDPAKAMETEKRALLLDAWGLDEAFRADVVGAFTLESPEDFDAAIEGLLMERCTKMDKEAAGDS